MFLSPRTIDGYRDDLFEKLQQKTRVGLVVYAIKNGIVTFQQTCNSLHCFFQTFVHWAPPNIIIPQYHYANYKWDNG